MGTVVGRYSSRDLSVGSEGPSGEKGHFGGPEDLEMSCVSCGV